MAQIEGVDSLAMVGGRGCDVQRIVDQASRPSLLGRLPQHRRVIRSAERSDVKMGQNVFRQKSPSLAWVDRRSERGACEYGVKLGGAVRTDYGFHFACAHLFKQGLGLHVVRVRRY
jgi:hypothetical protein